MVEAQNRDFKRHLRVKKSTPGFQDFIFHLNLCSKTCLKAFLREREDITFTTGWRKQCHLEDLLEAGLISESKVKRIESGHLLEAEAENDLAQWLHGTSPIAGLLIIQTGEKMSLYSAAKRGFLRRGTAISLLEAQAATGNVIDPITGEYMAVEQATRTGLIDRQYEGQ